MGSNRGSNERYSAASRSAYRIVSAERTNTTGVTPVPPEDGLWGRQRMKACQLPRQGYKLSSARREPLLYTHIYAQGCNKQGTPPRTSRNTGRVFLIGLKMSGLLFGHRGVHDIGEWFTFAAAVNRAITSSFGTDSSSHSEGASFKRHEVIRSIRYVGGRSETSGEFSLLFFNVNACEEERASLWLLQKKVSYLLIESWETCSLDAPDEMISRSCRKSGIFRITSSCGLGTISLQKLVFVCI